MKLRLERTLENFFEKGLTIVVLLKTNTKACFLAVGVVAEVGTFVPYFVTDIVGVMFHVMEMLNFGRISDMCC